MLYILSCLEPVGDRLMADNASSINVTIRSYKNSNFKSDLRLPKIFFLIYRLLGTGDMADSMANC